MAATVMVSDYKKAWESVMSLLSQKVNLCHSCCSWKQRQNCWPRLGADRGPCVKIFSQEKPVIGKLCCFRLLLMYYCYCFQGMLTFLGSKYPQLADGSSEVIATTTQLCILKLNGPWRTDPANVCLGILRLCSPWGGGALSLWWMITAGGLNL